MMIFCSFLVRGTHGIFVTEGKNQLQTQENVLRYYFYPIVFALFFSKATIIIFQNRYIQIIMLSYFVSKSSDQNQRCKCFTFSNDGNLFAWCNTEWCVIEQCSTTTMF